MRFLLISILFLLSACGSYPKKQNFKEVANAKVEITNPYFSNSAEDYVYKADITVFKNSFSGIFIVKKLDKNHHRIVFTTEMGNKLFDFEFLQEIFKINHILQEMDKKVLINILKRDFFALIKENPLAAKTFTKDDLRITEADLLSKKHYYHLTNKQLTKFVRSAKGKEKVTFLFSGISDNIAEAIEIVHQNIKLKIRLKKI